MKKYSHWLYPILAFALFAPVSPYLDLFVSGLFYRMGGGSGFPSNGFTDFLFDWGVVPAQLVFVIALLGYLFSYGVRKWKMARKPCLYLFLVLAIGSGFVTNWAFKDHWGRPRPKQLERFGGDREFLPFYRPNLLGENYQHQKSFPCGHCTMGFYFLAFIPLGWRMRSRALVLFGWIAGIGLGTLMGISRMMQGGHFLSDVFAGALIMWVTALLIDYLVYEDFV